MQSKLNVKFEQLKSLLNEQSIPFTSEVVKIDSEDSTAEVDAYAIETKNSFSFILPNFLSKKPEFILLNDSLISHLRSKGMTNDEIMSNQKVWKHYANFANYSKTLLTIEN